MPFLIAYPLEPLTARSFRITCALVLTESPVHRTNGLIWSPRECAPQKNYADWITQDWGYIA